MRINAKSALTEAPPLSITTAERRPAAPIGISGEAKPEENREGDIGSL